MGKLKNNPAPLLFTTAIRKDLCGDTYWVSSKKVELHLGDVMGYDDSRVFELKKVIHSLLDEAYKIGYEKGQENIRQGLRKLIGTEEGN